MALRSTAPLRPCSARRPSRRGGDARRAELRAVISEDSRLGVVAEPDGCGPFFHAGNARTLEEMFASQFSGHYQSAVASVFTPSTTQIRQLVAFVLSIDESTAAVPIPAVGNSGGSICHYP